MLALNVHNDYNAYIIAPSFRAMPWYGNHPTDPAREYESFMVEDLVPWVKANLSVTGQEEHWLVGFSKSGFGAVTLLMRNPTVFAAAAAWDFPANLSSAEPWNMLDNYGTEANFQDNFRLTSSWIAERRVPFQRTPHLWLSGDDAFFRDAVDGFAALLSSNGVQFVKDGGTQRSHTWTSGWLPRAVAGIQKMRYGTRDDFNRADGELGPNWTQDLAWGNGAGLVGGKLAADQGSEGAYYWTAGSVDADQYGQITITGPVSDWVGVAVRASMPFQGYWAAVKSDGAHLYVFVNGSHHEIGKDPTAWTTGDMLRLEVRTVAASTARLSVLRNGEVLFTYDETTAFIADGHPGVGVYAISAPLAVDDWSGGSLGASPPPPPPPPVTSSVFDDFNRVDGGLGPNWTQDLAWGSGAGLVGGQLASSRGSEGVYYWTADSVGADQYGQITIAGPVSDWLGVAVRATVPFQGYWAAVKSDGVHLYAFVNGTYRELGQDPTPWTTGNVLRLEVRTVAASTARLTVLRNGETLFTYDEATDFIGDGHPGLGVYAISAPLFVDDWSGGSLASD